MFLHLTHVAGERGAKYYLTLRGKRSVHMRTGSQTLGKVNFRLAKRQRVGFVR